MRSRLQGWRGMTLLMTLLTAATVTACGGGGGGGGVVIPPGVSPVFTGAANPGGAGFSMTAGTVTNANFQVQIRVDGIDDFYGASFQLTFDPVTADFLTASGAGSVLAGTGISTQFLAQELSPGVLTVTATRRDETLGGVDVGGTAALLITLNFEALDEDASNPFAFGAAQTREVQICTTGGASCTLANVGTFHWTGGTLVVTSTN